MHAEQPKQHATQPDVKHQLGVDEYQLAEALKVSVGFLRKDRRMAKRIPFYKLGDLVRYDIDRVREALIAIEEGGAKGARPKRSAAPKTPSAHADKGGG